MYAFNEKHYGFRVHNRRYVIYVCNVLVKVLVTMLMRNNFILTTHVYAYTTVCRAGTRTTTLPLIELWGRVRPCRIRRVRHRVDSAHILHGWEPENPNSARKPLTCNPQWRRVAYPLDTRATGTRHVTTLVVGNLQW